MTDFVAPTVDWAALSPVVIVLLAAVVGVLVEAFVPARVRRTVQLTLAVAALAGAIIAVAALWSGVEETGGTVVLGGSLLVDGPTLVLQATIALLALVSLLIIADRTETGEDAFAPNAAAVPGSDYEELARRKGVQQTEIYPLVLFATGGMLIFPATGDLLTLFVALEVLSLPLYLLTGMARRRRLLSQEASMKYFLLGAFSSALLLFGIALVYGYSGSLRYSEIAEATQVPGGLDSLLLVGSVLILSGLLFKVGAVPFHTWTPDVYQGAPTPITGFMAACTKVAAFGALLRIVYTMLPGLAWDLGVVLWTVAILTMVVGTVAALVQTDMKRVLGYSSIAHAGFILTGIIALNQAGIVAVLFYLLVYGAATIGAFGIVWLVRERAGGRDEADGHQPDPRRGHAPVAVGRPRPDAPAARPHVRAVPALVRGHPADGRLRGEVLGVLRRGRGWRVAAGAHRRAGVVRRGVLLRADHRADVLHGARRRADGGAHRRRPPWRPRRRASPWPVTRRWPSRRSRSSRRARPSRRP